MEHLTVATRLIGRSGEDFRGRFARTNDAATTKSQSNMRHWNRSDRHSLTSSLYRFIIPYPIESAIVIFNSLISYTGLSFSIKMSSTFILTRRLPGITHNIMLPSLVRSWASSSRMSTTLDSNTISQITAKEKELTGSDQPVKGGPTAQAQKHVGKQLDSSIVSDITKGEQKITKDDGPVQDGPSSLAQSMLTQVSQLFVSLPRDVPV